MLYNCFITQKEQKNMITITEIQKRLIEEIKLSKLSQSFIAKSLGVRSQSISNIIVGKSLPPLDIFANLCALLDVEASEILGLK